ncbi:hypothetical protein DW995_01110 [Bacteroides sp. AM51-7]|nr:hypothetical protein DW995_01110 [Bacteroides sp. AM51-7]
MFYGGIQRVGIDYIHLLKSRGYEVDVYILNPKKTDEIVNELPEDCEIKNMPLPLALCLKRIGGLPSNIGGGNMLFL